VVYQVIVDRFAPPDDLDAKRHLYPDPKRVKPWDVDPERGEYLPDAGVWSHEVDFWGGDLDSLRRELDYIDGLGVDVLYLNPVKHALTNHKYDATDYLTISPEYGDRDDLRRLAGACHERGMKIMLDGVFNHTGRSASWFEDAMSNDDSSYRDWYFIDERYPRGYRSWYNTANLPELNLENPDVRAFLWAGDDSVVKSFLRDGVDGWRLDVAYDLGFRHLTDLREAAQSVKPQAWIVGEIWSYPDEWAPALDGVMNFHARSIVMGFARGDIDGPQASDLMRTMIDDFGIEPALRSWLVLDNHDTERLRHLMPDDEERRLAQLLQFTLPGAPVVYYGSEIGMTGGHDPESRGPMRWSWISQDDAATAGSESAAGVTSAELEARAVDELRWMRTLIELRRTHPALRYGDYRRLDAQHLFAFQRRTDRRAETVLVVLNNTDEPITETISVRDAKQMGYAPFIDSLTGDEFRPHSGLLRVRVERRSGLVLSPKPVEPGKYSPFKRMH
jgi:glycosidase